MGSANEHCDRRLLLSNIIIPETESEEEEEGKKKVEGCPQIKVDSMCRTREVTSDEMLRERMTYCTAWCVYIYIYFYFFVSL